MRVVIPVQAISFDKKIKLIHSHRILNGSGLSEAKDFAENLPGELGFENSPKGQMIIGGFVSSGIIFSVED